MERQLMVIDIVDTLVEYTSIQPDIDPTKCRAAAEIAQKVDLGRILGKENVLRCLNPANEADNELLLLVIPAFAYFTFSRLLKLFPGTMTDGGYVIEADSSDKNVTKTVANEYFSVGETFLQDAIDFLKIESPNGTEVHPEKMTPGIRVFGGRESR
jgi:hypothetical protein